MTRLFKTLFLAGGMGLGLLASGMGSVRADIAVTFLSVTPEGGNFRYTYRADLTQGHTLWAGDFFTIYDFAGFVPGSNTQPPGWLFFSALTGLTPPSVSPMDDPSIPNLTFVNNHSITEEGSLGTFSALSTIGTTGTGKFAFRDTAGSTRFAPDVKFSNTGSVTVPVAAVVTPPVTVVPEPGTLALLGLGVAPFGLGRRRSRKS